ncbi:MAG TPA: hypothetical protein VKO18_12070 [Terriglobia bacterium]|nr:hypothetical protein [Terriglobia bacterium]
MKLVLRLGIAITLLASIAAAQSQGGGKSEVLFSATPLMDLGTQTYKGFEGGLYPNGSDLMPGPHQTAGSLIVNQIQPLDTNGDPDPDGKVVFLSIGMSNAMEEFMLFISNAELNAKVNKTTLAIENGAETSQTACYWTAATGRPPCSHPAQNEYDRVMDNVLKPAGLSDNQVQVVWIKDANPSPGVSGCGAKGTSPCQSLCNPTVKGCVNTAQTTEALRYEQQLGEILRAAKTRYPKLQMAFLSTRVYAGYVTTTLNPEPYAYEYGFSAKWLIQAQITQMQTGVVDPVAGNLNYNSNTAPWVAWGSYLWADGPIPRSDGLVWCDGQTTAPCLGEVDYQSDGTHPDGKGANKISTMLMNFFLTSPFTEPWFAAAP